MPSILTRYAKPDEALLQADEVKRGIANLIKAAEVKKGK